MSQTKRNSPRGFEHPRHRGDGDILHEAPLPVPPLRPRIGMDQVDSLKRLRRRPGHEVGGIAREQPDVADIVGLDLRQDFRHAVDVGLAADEAGVRKGQRFGDQMLAATEADFEPDMRQPAGRTARRGWRGRERRCRAPGAAAAARSGRPGASAVCGPCAARRTSRAGARPRHRRAMCAVVGIAGGDAHRSVWYSRYNSRALGSIDEMYICS